MAGPLEVARTSATGERKTVRTSEKLAMLIDTTTCIGCKACEVACVEWNDLKIEPEYGERMLSSFQTMPHMTPSFWNLIRFDELPVNQERRPAPDGGGLMMLMRKDMCMHCAEPGCLIACPAEGAIVQYTNGLVDFDQDKCIGCGYCMTGCPFDVPKLDKATNRVFKCTMCSDRVENGLGPACVKACPTGCLEFGTKDDMRARAEKRAHQVKEEGFAAAGVYDPPGVGGTGVVYVLHHADQPELYGGLPREPKIDPQIRFWKGPLKWLGGLGTGASMAVAALHFLAVGARKGEAHVAAAPEREVIRYSFSERLLHWTVAATFVYLMLTGLGLFSPKLAWLMTVLGGGQVIRAWHPIVGVVFVGALLLQLARWWRDLRLEREDLAFLKAMPDYIAGRDDKVPPSGRFNAGQKILFKTQVVLGLVLLATGIPIWFPESFARDLRLWAVAIHSAAAVVAVISLVVHVHMAAIVTKGALSAMTGGKVPESWARHHHARWLDSLRNKP